jgi:bifunctional non-homologous end joining protein LigD
MTKTKLQLTNLDKIYWPKEKYTKGDLINYYDSISKVILPYLKNRPESLHRFPNGIKGKSFFQKNFTSEVPDFVDTFKFYSESNDAELRWLVVNNKDALLYLVNLGCIEMNPWNSTTKKPENPTWMVIDLDPDGNHCDQVVEAAQVTHNILDKIGADNYCKTSGKTGMHIFVPMGNKYTFDQVRTFAEIVANLVHEQIPDFTSVERMPKARKGKIYVDFLQNRISQTLACAYSVRPWPGATVSAPLKWSEVKKGWNPNDYTIKNIHKRLSKYGDLWKPVLGKGMNLAKALQRLSNINKNNLVS